MQADFPLARVRFFPPVPPPVLGYAVALLSTTLALLVTLLFSQMVESRLVVFAMAVMVSAWYGGWRPGLVATALAVVANAYFSLPGASASSAALKGEMLHLAMFVPMALVICWFNAALRSAQDAVQRSEANFRSLVINAPYGICRCYLDGRLLDVNPALVAMLGYASAEELLERNLATDLYRDPGQWARLVDYYHSLQQFDAVEVEWKRSDGTPIMVRLSGRPLRPQGDDVSFELVAEDVTERRALEQQFRQAQRMEAIGRLAGGIAHDFNNLLMVISGYSEFLLERLGPDRALRGPAEEICSAADRASSLTRQLLAFSRKQVLAPKVLDLNAVLTENLKMLPRLIGEDIELVTIPGAALGRVKADPGQIEQVIMNLAVNARDAMPLGGKLTIETANLTLDETYARQHAAVAPGEYVMLAISDTGTGMDAETQSRVFEPFFTTKGQKGTGLGLSTVYGIVKQSGGYIWVYSELGRGTTLKIYLPRVAEAAEAIQPEEPAGEVLEGRETILLVEDEPKLRRLACEALERKGYTVLEAVNGSEAVEICLRCRGPIHLLLTDVIMPGMNGRELAQRLAGLRPATRVLYMSGYTENAICHNGTLDAGTMFLQKPFTLEALTRKVRAVLEEKAPAALPAPAQELPVTAERARRFSLHLPVRYRLVGESAWRQGTTENISRSGMLFRAEKLAEPSAQVEISLSLPVEVVGPAATEVLCRGEVVRAVPPTDAAMSPALAARILEYHFLRGSPAAQA